jgi:hypothetical protein
VLDGWQEHVADVAMGERDDGRWAASDVGLIASRQNGKNEVVLVRELYGVLVLGEWVIHAAHEFKTTMAAYRRLMTLVEANPDVRDCMIDHHASPAVGYDMRFRGGGKIEFIARTRSSGRGRTGDLLILDEAQELHDDHLDALLPTISARPNPQVWYLGSAPHLDSTVFHRIRARGRAGEADRLAYFEFSADPDADLNDRQAWAQANPAFGVRISEEYIAAERGSMSDAGFAAERLSISPDPLEAGGPFGAQAWANVCDADAAASLRAPIFALDVNPERTYAAIAMANDGPVVEIVDYRPGLEWVPARCVELREKYHAKFAVDKRSPAAAFIDELKRRKVRLIEFDTTDLVRACGAFYDRVSANTVKVRTNDDLNRAVAATVKRPVGDAWAWGRKQSARADISPLVAVTLAVWAVDLKVKPRVVNLAAAMAQLEQEP